MNTAKWKMQALALMLCASMGTALAQNPPAVPQQPGNTFPQGAGQNAMPAQQSPLSAAIPAQAERLRPTYVLQEGDQIMIRAQDTEEIADRPFRIESDGTVNLPLVGRLQAAGLTVESFEAALTAALRQYVVNPRVSVTVTQFKSDPVFVVGAFRAPGIYPLLGRRTLVELLTSVGGLLPNASRRLRVTRKIEAGKLPMSNAVLSEDGRSSSVDIDIKDLQTSVNSDQDIELEAFDVISAERAEMVFTLGAIGRIGGIEIGDRESLSMLQALALSGGLAPNADREKAVILRQVLDTSRRAQIPVNLKRIQNGEINDFPLLPNDILYVPPSWKFIATQRAVNTGVGLVSGILLFALIGR